MCNYCRSKVNWDGLTLAQVIAQSAAIHPQWTAADHKAYIVSETAFDADDLKHGGRSVWQCEFPGGCHEYALHGQKLCFEHQVSLTRLFAPADGSAVIV